MNIFQRRQLMMICVFLITVFLEILWVGSVGFQFVFAIVKFCQNSVLQVGCGRKKEPITTLFSDFSSNSTMKRAFL